MTNPLFRMDRGSHFQTFKKKLFILAIIKLVEFSGV